MPPGHRPRTAFPDIRGPPQKKQTAAQKDTASLSSSYGIISKIFANRFVPESECKSTDFYNNCQILNTLFSKEKDDDRASMVHNLFSNSIFRSIKKSRKEGAKKATNVRESLESHRSKRGAAKGITAPATGTTAPLGELANALRSLDFEPTAKSPARTTSKDVADEEAPTGDDKSSFRIVYLR